MNARTVRPANREDAAAIARVQVRGWRETYTGIIAQRLLDALDEERIATRWAQIIGIGEHLVLVACSETTAEVVGFASAGLPSDPVDGFDCELHKLYLLSEVQGRGIGRQLVRECAKRMREHGCRSLLSHVLGGTPAAGFYERLGARVVKSTPIVMDGEPYLDVVYGWPDIEALIAKTFA